MAEKKDSADEPDAPKGSSKLALIAVFLVITMASLGAGFAVSTFVLKPPAPLKAVVISTEPASETDGEVEGEASKEADSSTAYRTLELAPILTNLLAPSEVWVRMELAVVSKQAVAQDLADAIHQDLFAFMKTVKLQQVQGPSGYHSLRSELIVRARQRSKGVVEGVLVRTLLFE